MRERRYWAEAAELFKVMLMIAASYGLPVQYASEVRGN
jgi:hypothetical protein